MFVLLFTFVLELLELLSVFAGVDSCVEDSGTVDSSVEDDSVEEEPVDEFSVVVEDSVDVDSSVVEDSGAFDSSLEDCAADELSVVVDADDEACVCAACAAACTRASFSAFS